MRYATLFLFIVTTFSCKEKPAPLSAAKLSAVLTDLHLAEALGQMQPIDSNGYKIKNRDSIFTHYQYILNNHNLSITTLNNALDWYGKNPNEFEIVYEEVLGQLSTIKEKNEPPVENYSDTSRQRKISINKD